MAWFDVQASGTLIGQLTENVDAIHKGIGNKLGLFVQYMSTFISGLAIGFIRGWKLAFVALATLPINLIAFGVFGWTLSRFANMEVSAYGRAGAVVGEILSCIRTVVAYGGEEKEHQRYVGNLTDAEKVAIKKSSAIGAGACYVSGGGEAGGMTDMGDH